MLRQIPSDCAKLVASFFVKALRIVGSSPGNLVTFAPTVRKVGRAWQKLERTMILFRSTARTTQSKQS